jgi:2-succinyl-5-enolpyruvyl-6-hydroxy-3-cyclohexene-1-carboxylate synthase
VTDTFMNLTRVIQGDAEVVEDQIRFLLEQEPHPFVQKWENLLAKVRAHAAAYKPDYSEMAAVKCFETQLQLMGTGLVGYVHYANSTAIRLANIFAQHSVYCNRGVNGIEGSLSTAAGFSVVSEETVFCVIGDLSFFYDQNALWNQNLQGNFRILLLNNGKGGIFNLLRGLEQSPARDKYVAAEHHTSAEGICQQNDIVYLKAENMEQLKQGVSTLLNINSSRPVLLEVFTDPAEDERVYKDYYKTLKI